MANAPQQFGRNANKFSKYEHMNVQSFMDRVSVSLNEYGELCYELIHTEDVSGIPKIENILQELQFKSAYGDCVKSTVMETFKTGFRDTNITDKWV